MSDKGLMSRLVQVHRPDCDLFDPSAPLPSPVPVPHVAVLNGEEATAYGAACQPVYEDLRRVVGQLSGLAILAELTATNAVRDLAELGAARARWQAVADKLAALDGFAAFTAHRRQIRACHDFCGRALSNFDALSTRTSNEEAFDRIARHIRLAYAHLRAATADEAGLSMVDLSHACCSCGR